MQEKICPLLTRSADKPFCCLGEKAVLGGASCTRRYAVRPEPAHCWISPAALMPNKKEPCGAGHRKGSQKKRRYYDTTFEGALQ